MSQPTAAYDYAATGFVRRSIRLLGTRRPVAQISARLLPSLDRVIYRVTRGRVVFSAWVTGLPVLLLTTKGARSGELHTAWVLGIPDGDGLIIVAANFGQRANPAWYRNIRAHPRVSVVLGDAEREYYARELSGGARDRGFDRALSLNPGYRRFEKWSGERAIPVLRLDPQSVPPRLRCH